MKICKAAESYHRLMIIVQFFTKRAYAGLVRVEAHSHEVRLLDGVSIGAMYCLL